MNLQETLGIFSESKMTVGEDEGLADRRRWFGYEAGGRAVQLWISNVSPPCQTPRRGSKEKQYKTGRVQSLCWGKEILNFCLHVSGGSSALVAMVHQAAEPPLGHHPSFIPLQNGATIVLHFFLSSSQLKRNMNIFQKPHLCSQLSTINSPFSPQVSNIGKMQTAKPKGSFLGLKTFRPRLLSNCVL